MKNLLKPSLILLIIAGAIFICEGTNQIRIIRGSPIGKSISKLGLQHRKRIIRCFKEHIIAKLYT